MRPIQLFLLFVCLVSCGKSNKSPLPQPTTMSVTNATAAPLTVYVSFGSDSKVRPAAWKFCKASSPLNCTFPLPPKGKQTLPLNGSYLNATLSFDAPVGCGTTKIEFNVNNPKWFDTYDISLVDGFNHAVAVEVTDSSGKTALGPAVGPADNEKVYGVYPLGCDICVKRSKPSCGRSIGTDGCKTGTQYKPDVPCQHQGVVKGGGGADIEVAVLPQGS